MSTLNQVTLKNQYGEVSVNQIVAGANGLVMTLQGGGGVYSGAGAPAFSAPAGSIYVRNDGGTASLVFYVNNATGNNWAAVTVP